MLLHVLVKVGGRRVCCSLGMQFSFSSTVINNQLFSLTRNSPHPQSSTFVNSVMQSRLDRLRKLVEPDLQALPERAASPELSDDDTGGGISLDTTASNVVELQADEQEQEQEQKKAEPKACFTAVPTKLEEAPEKLFLLKEGATSLHNVSAASEISKFPSAALPPLHLSKGELSPAGQQFTPITAFSKYPYKFCNLSNSQAIASAFFDAGKFWDREWDL